MKDTFGAFASLHVAIKLKRDRHNVVNILLKVLERAGYYADPFDKLRSHLHDVSHAIYAAAADVFVTGDERYAKRVRAVYHFLGLKTRVVLTGDFIRDQGCDRC